MSFKQICEDTIYRFQNGGILPGDLVKIHKDALNHPKVKELSQEYKELIKQAIKTDLNLRAGAVKSNRPNTSTNYGGGQTDAPTDFYVDVVAEYAPGLWRNPMTLPIEVIERIDNGANIAPVPDSMKRKSKVTKPEKTESKDENRRTATKNTKLPTGKVSDGRDQAIKPKPYKESTDVENISCLYESVLKKNDIELDDEVSPDTIEEIKKQGYVINGDLVFKHFGTSGTQLVGELKDLVLRSINSEDPESPMRLYNVSKGQFVY